MRNKDYFSLKTAKGFIRTKESQEIHDQNQDKEPNNRIEFYKIIVPFCLAGGGIFVEETNYYIDKDWEYYSEYYSKLSEDMAYINHHHKTIRLKAENIKELLLEIKKPGDI